VALIQDNTDHLDAIIGDLDVPGSVREIKHIHALPMTYVPGIMQQGGTYPNYALLGITPSNKAIAAIWEKGPHKPILLGRIRQFELDLRIICIEVYPTEKRVSWLATN